MEGEEREPRKAGLPHIRPSANTAHPRSSHCSTTIHPLLSSTAPPLFEGCGSTTPHSIHYTIFTSLLLAIHCFAHSQPYILKLIINCYPASYPVAKMDSPGCPQPRHMPQTRAAHTGLTSVELPPRAVEIGD